MNLELLASGALDAPSDILIFFGRFHPLVVHLPIGFLLLAVIAQVATRWPKFKGLAPYTSYLWGLGAISALITVIFGYFLSLSGDYDADTLFWHKWSGVAVFIVSLGFYLLARKVPKVLAWAQWPLVVLTAGSLFYTGHLGGNLTHGPTYLFEYAPNAIRGMAGMPPKTKPRKKVTVLDSADIFLDLVQPMMNSRCTSCHNDGKKKGDLLLTSYGHMMAGGENGEIIVPGDAEASELFRRITLPEDHDDFMPTEGKRPLSDVEVDLLEWWIIAGAPKEGYVTQLDQEKKIVGKVNSYLGLDKNNLLNTTVAAPDAALIDSLQDRGFIINRLMKDNHFVEANFALSARNLEDADLELLQQLKAQLLWLNLSNAGATDAQMEKVGQLENLMKLDLNRNPISDLGLGHLSKLTNLESINLYDTQVSEGLLEVLPKLTRLQKAYVWKTKASDTLVQQLKATNPKLQIISNREEIAGQEGE